MELSISNSILQHIENIEITSHKLKENNFDCIISGGGLKGYYNFGTCIILKKMHDKQLINIRHFVCVSSGAIIVTCLLCNISLSQTILLYDELKKSNHDLHKSVILLLDKMLPHNAHELCNSRIHIILSELTTIGFKKVTIKNFENRKYLIDVLSASIFLPLFTSNNMHGILIDNKLYYDGWFSGNIPIIENNNLPQLIIETHNVDFSSTHVLSLTNKNPELLIIKGVIEIEKLINNNMSEIPFKWHNKNIKKSFTPINNFIMFLMSIVINIYIFIKHNLKF